MKSNVEVSIDRTRVNIREHNDSSVTWELTYIIASGPSDDVTNAMRDAEKARLQFFEPHLPKSGTPMQLPEVLQDGMVQCSNCGETFRVKEMPDMGPFNHVSAEDTARYFAHQSGHLLITEAQRKDLYDIVYNSHRMRGPDDCFDALTNIKDKTYLQLLIALAKDD